MGYRIQYGREAIRTAIAEPVKMKEKRPGIVPFILITTAAVCLLLQKGGALTDYFIPGNKEVTSAAFTTLIDNVKGGEPVADAVTAFCREIIDNANIQE